MQTCVLHIFWRFFWFIHFTWFVGAAVQLHLLFFIPFPFWNWRLRFEYALQTSKFNRLHFFSVICALHTIWKLQFHLRLLYSFLTLLFPNGKWEWEEGRCIHYWVVCNHFYATYRSFRILQTVLMVFQRFKCLFSFLIVCVCWFFFVCLFPLLFHKLFRIGFLYYIVRCALVCCFYLIVHWTTKLVNFLNGKRFPSTELVSFLWQCLERNAKKKSRKFWFKKIKWNKS